MTTEISDVQELTVLTSKLRFSTDELIESFDNLKSIIRENKDYDGIDITTAGNILKNNLTSLSDDLKSESENMKNYAMGIEKLDIDDFTTQNAN